MSAAKTGSAVATNGVNLVNKDDTGCVAFCLIKQVSDAGGTHTNEHLYKLGTADVEEGHAGFTSHCPSHQRFAGAGRAN